MSSPESEQDDADRWMDLPRAVAVLIGPLGLPVSDWATVRWSDFQRRTRTRWTLTVAGQERDVPEALWQALLSIGSGFQTVGHAPRFGDCILSVVPGINGRFMGERWVRLLVKSDTNYSAYIQIRESYEAEIAAGTSDRTAWVRARAYLLRRPAPVAGRSGPPLKLEPIPAKLRAAYLQLAARSGVAPTTAKGYRSALLRLFERSNGQVPGVGELEALLDEAASGPSYCAGMRSAWSALVRAAEVDGIALPKVMSRR